MLFPRRLLMHSIGLGGFYYSVAAFEAPEDPSLRMSGKIQVRWSEGQHPKFHPADEFQKPLDPWEPRRDS
jgi:hypothetical protein